MISYRGVWVVALSLWLAACGSMQQQSSGGASLYDRLGGKSAITAVVDDFVANVAADNRVNKFFVHADPVKLKGHLVDQICQGTGGPCTYKGRDMKTTHQDMAIGDTEFNAVVENLVKSLDKFKVPAREKDELLALLGGMKGAIVNQ